MSRHRLPSGCRVVIVDDHVLLAQALAAALVQGGLAAEALVDLGERAVVDAIEERDPDLVLLDFDLNGPSSIEIIKSTRSRTRVVVLSGSAQLVDMAMAVEAGAIGFLSKAAPFRDILEAIRRAADGGSLIGDRERAELDHLLRSHRAEERRRSEPFSRLTRREREVLYAIAHGQSAQEIAEASFVALGTVRSQLRAIREKLGVTSQVAAIGLAWRAGWPLSHMAFAGEGPAPPFAGEGARPRITAAP